jgi:integrase
MHIQDRWFKTVDGGRVKTKQHGSTRRYQARYVDPAGRERSKTFPRKLDAQRWLDEVTADLVTGRYVDPGAGRVTLRRFGERWLAAQTFDPSTREAVASRLRVHVYPHLGSVELRNVRPSTVQGWLRGRQAELAPTYVRVLLANLSALLAAAVEDGLIPRNPCASSAVRAPKIDRRRIVPWTVEQVQAVTEAHPVRYRAVPLVGAGLGLRQGEVFGLAVEDVDFLRRRVVVRQQVKLLGGRPVLAPPKGGAEREVPLPDVVAVALAERIRTFPPRRITLPWRTLDGDPREAELVFTTRESGPLIRNHYNPHVWKPALETAELEPTRANGMHALRHHYASALLEGGVSIRAVAEYLGHADPGFTLRTYAHLMPQAEDRARDAIDAALGPRAEPGRNGAETGS